MDIKNKSYSLSLFVIIFSILICFIPLNHVVLADDSNTKSITGNYFNKVFGIELNDGTNLIEKITSNENKRKIINDEIYNKSLKKNYSLYDRFGGNVKFIPYFGETKISTGLLDRFYTKYEENDAEFTLSAGDVKKLFESPAISNNVIYENRPNILSSVSIAAGNIDPRVSAYSGISSIGGDAALGNFMLSISNSITTMVGWLSGSGIYKEINDVWSKISVYIKNSVLQYVIYLFLPIAMYIFIFRVVIYGIKVLKGTFNIKSFMEELLGTCLSLGFIFTLLINPMFFSSNLIKIVSIIDSSMDITMKLDSNEITTSDNIDNIRVSTLWKKTVFDPWCYGMFREKYNNLYTMYDENIKHKKMLQSHEDVKTSWKDNTIKYDSASLTGDIKIQVGKNNYIQNWAALAWSTQSIYHIDSVTDVSDVKDKDLKDKKRESWPKATTTPMNDQIFVDNFRWLDAKLNISPQYYSEEDISMNYYNANKYKENFIGAGLNSIYMTILLIPIGILVFRKLVNSLKIILFGYILCYSSIMNIIMPKKYSIYHNISTLIKLLYDFLWWSIIVFLGITTYTKITGHGKIGDFIWLLIGIYLCKFKPIRTTKQLRYFINNTKNLYKRLSNNILNKIESRN